ncbi:MAG: hypothetical protein ACYDEX_02810 [Mobilitalea sp.]
MELFNQSSVETYTSPDQLDKSVKIISIRGWIILAAAILMITSALLWGFLGNMPEKMDVNGIMVTRGGVYIISSLNNGVISDISVQKDDYINQGDVIARLRADDEVKSTNQINDLIIALQNYGLNSSDDIISSDLLELYNIKESIRELDGIIADTTKEQDQKQYLDYMKQKDILINDFNLNKTYKINEYTKQLEIMKKNIEESKQIISPVSGIVKNVEPSVGSIVQSGSIFATVLLGENTIAVGDLQAVFYVPLQSGKKIIPGMKVNIYPSTVNPQKHGHMRGVITQVSKYAIDNVDMLKTLGDNSLVNQFMSLGPVLEIKTEIYKDPESSNGFQWSSEAGEQVNIVDNTICTAKIIIKDKKPISNIFPFIE